MTLRHYQSICFIGNPEKSDALCDDEYVNVNVAPEPMLSLVWLEFGSSF